MKPTPEEIIEASRALAILQFYPVDPAAREQIMLLLSRLATTKERLDWLVETMIHRVGVWRGPVEMRGVYCSRFRPADGVDGNCRETPGFTPEEIEAENTRGIPAAPELKRLDQKAIKGLLG